MNSPPCGITQPTTNLFEVLCGVMLTHALALPALLPVLPLPLQLLRLVPRQALAHVEVGVAARVLVRVAALDVQPAELVEVGGCGKKGEKG